jgi:hypothetical protein
MTHSLPDPEAIKARLKSCRQEVAELKKLLRLVEAARRAEQARQLREGKGVANA